MLEVLHLPADDAPEAAEVLASWPPEAAAEDCAARLVRMTLHGERSLIRMPGHERVLTAVDGTAVVEHGEDAPATLLRELEPRSFPGAWNASVVSERGAADVLEVVARSGAFRAAVQAVRLGRRRLRETLEPGQAFVLALDGPARIRVTDEEEPYRLDRDELLWVRGLGGGEELEIEGEDGASAVLLVRLATA